MVELLNAISDALAGAGTPLGFAALMFFATIGLGVFLNGDQRTYLGLWLSGEFSRGEWARSFNAFFDTVFGANPLSLRFLAASAAVSLLATWAIWELLGGLGVLGGRMQALPIASVLLAALLVNVAADYVSLIETRWLLRRLEGWTSTWAQAAGLAADALFTAAIILIALAAYDALLPLLPAGLTPEGAEAGSFRPSEIVGAFSFYTVLFYSTFATSVWSWLFVLSAALLRGLGRLRPERWTVVNERPVLILATVVFGVAWIGAQGAGAVLARGADGVSLADRGLCRVFRDEICLRLGDLTENEQARLDLLLDACAGGVTTECLWRGVPTWEGTPEEAARLFAADCAGGNAGGCTNLGVLHQQGRGMDQDFAEAARLYRQGCDGGDARGCSNLGVLHHQGLGMDPDLAEAARRYRQGCDGGDAGGCTNLGVLHERGLGMDPDLAEAARLYRQGCDGGNAPGCTNLGFLHERGLGMDPDLAEAARLFRQGCDGGEASGCSNLGFLHHQGLGVDPDLAEGARLYRQGCDGGSAYACDQLKRLGEE